MAWLSQPSVDAIGALVVRAPVAQLEPPAQFALDRRGEAFDGVRVLGDLRRERKRREPGGVEDLVRPRTSDSGDRALVTEQRMEAA